MLASTVHWKPLLNGHSGFMPESYRRMAEAMRTFPDPPTTDLLRAAGTTHVIVHRDRFGAGRDLLLRVMKASGEFQRVAGDEQVRCTGCSRGRNQRPPRATYNHRSCRSDPCRCKPARASGPMK